MRSSCTIESCVLLACACPAKTVRETSAVIRASVRRRVISSRASGSGALPRRGNTSHGQELLVRFDLVPNGAAPPRHREPCVASRRHGEHLVVHYPVTLELIPMKDSDLILSRSRRPLVIGIGGGGDVVGALATAEAARLYHGARPLVGGIPWERRPIDPVPGPRGIDEIEDGEEIAPGVLLARASTRVRGRDVVFAESHMADFLGEPTVLVDVTGGPAAIAAGLAEAAPLLEADLIVFADVGGDVLAHGGEPGLGSPLCDAVMLAAAVRLERDGFEGVGGVFGPGCGGGVAVAGGSARVGDVAAAGGAGGGARARPPPPRPP